MITEVSPLQVLQTNTAASIRGKQALLEDAALQAIFDNAARHVIDCYRAGGRLYAAGNGGSAADAQHMVAEFVSRLARDRNPLPAESLTTDTSILTAIGNDYGYEHVFSRQLTAKLRPNDVFLGITTSGNSKNILSALEVCKEKGVKSLVFTGFSGGAAAKLSDYPLVVPGERTSTVQEIHILLAHSLCETVELAMFPPENA